VRPSRPSLLLASHLQSVAAFPPLPFPPCLLSFTPHPQPAGDVLDRLESRDPPGPPAAPSAASFEAAATLALQGKLGEGPAASGLPGDLVGAAKRQQHLKWVTWWVQPRGGSTSNLDMCVGSSASDLERPSLLPLYPRPW
jgi:hypothetical protein